MDQPNNLQGHLAAFFTTFIWATTFIAIKVLLGRFSPVEILFFRLVIAYAVLWLMSPHSIRYRDRREELQFAAAGLCGVTLFFIFQNTALTYTLASNFSVLVSISPFFTAILSHALLKDEELHASFFLGFAVAILGIFLIGFNGSFILKLNPLGDLLAVLSAFVWSIYSILMRQIGDRRYNTIQATRKIFFYGLLFLLPVLPFFRFRLGLERLANLPSLLNLVFLAVAASALCYVTWNYAVRVLGAVRSSVYIYLIPVLTIVVSAILIREPVTPVALAGAGLILAGLFLSEAKKKRKAEAA